MRQAVLDAFPGFTTPLEGRIPYMYPDTYGYITTGVGNLIDTTPHSNAVTHTALSLPWVHKSDGQPATADEIAADWQAVSDNADLYHSGGAGAFASLTQLRLTDDAIDTLVRNKLASNWQQAVSVYPDAENWPADAQLALMSMMWAMGMPGSHFPKFTSAVNGNPPDFNTAAGPPGDAGADPSRRGQAWINDSTNPGVRPRNLANKQLFTNAQAVLDNGVNPDVLYYSKGPDDGQRVDVPTSDNPVSVRSGLIVGIGLALSIGGIVYLMRS